MAGHKGHLGIGIILAISFWVVLFLVFSPIFPRLQMGSHKTDCSGLMSCSISLRRVRHISFPRCKKIMRSLWAECFRPPSR